MPHPAGILILPASYFAQDRPLATAREEKPVVGESKPLEDRILDQLIAHIVASTRASPCREPVCTDFKAAGCGTGRAASAQLPLFRRKAAPSFRESRSSDGRRRALRRLSIGDLGLLI
jgi:hypothetical protein